jgi:hypothetical protein
VGQLIKASAVSAVAASLDAGLSGHGRSYLMIAASSFALFVASLWLKGKGENKASTVTGLDEPAHPGVSSIP